MVDMEDTVDIGDTVATEVTEAMEDTVDMVLVDTVADCMEDMVLEDMVLEGMVLVGMASVDMVSAGMALVDMVLVDMVSEGMALLGKDSEYPCFLIALAYLFNVTHY